MARYGFDHVKWARDGQARDLAQSCVYGKSSRTSLVRDLGVRIVALPGDPIGLFGGLEVTCDILGNPIRGLPDVGAIEVP